MRMLVDKMFKFYTCSSLFSHGHHAYMARLCHVKHILKITVTDSNPCLPLQMSSIPDPIFWSGLKKLRALYLHDNPLGNLETLQNLTVCRCLTILTLYDTPLYLRKNYRHYVVNSIWTLKALDHHVISDEEIIEDAFFRGHFSALCPPFRLDLWLASSNVSNRFNVKTHF